VIILGIVGGFHDPAACILADGKIIAVAEEERFTRKKHAYGAFPENAARYCIKEAGLLWRDVNYVVYPFDLTRLIKSNQSIEPWKTEFDADKLRLLSFKEYYGGIELRVKTWCAERNLPRPQFIDHHSSHLASALFGSDYDRAALLSVDSRGEDHSTALAFGEGEKITEIARVPLPHSLGMLYTTITQFLGYQPYDGEGTVMGLAPYGEDRYRDLFVKIARPVEDAFQCDPQYLWNRRTDGFLSLADPWEAQFGSARPYRPDPRNGTDEHLAASLQACVSRIVKHLVKALYRRTGLKRLCIAGGVGLNAKLNGELLDLDEVEDLFVFPLANDAGCAIGAAYFLYNKLTGKRPEPIQHVFLGPQFSDMEAWEAAAATGMQFSEPENLVDRVAEILSTGKVVGWVQGRMEAGPRALGGRCILARPDKPEAKNAVNIRVKRREPWRPFAATILDSHRDEYLEGCRDARFMIINYKVKPAAMDKLIAASHIDGTNRAQVLDRHSNPLYYDLVRAFGEKTGVFALLNTSFNLRRQPMVCAPKEAAEIFINSGMDALVLGRYLIEKS